jgi:hypothetical protein
MQLHGTYCQTHQQNMNIPATELKSTVQNYAEIKEKIFFPTFPV